MNTVQKKRRNETDIRGVVGTACSYGKLHWDVENELKLLKEAKEWGKTNNRADKYFKEHPECPVLEKGGREQTGLS